MTMRRSSKTAWGLLLATWMLTSAGCGSGGDQPELGEVSGVVTLDGQALSGVEVLFGPEEGRSSTGITNENGEYELTYIGRTKGAKVGPHTVILRTYQEDESDPTGRLPEKVPAKYHNRTNPILTAEVQSGHNSIDFELDSK